MARGPLVVGIDSHHAERDGEGNATYTRNLVSALYELPDRVEFALLAGDPGHAFYAELPPRPGSRAVGVPQGAGVLRLLATLAPAAARAGAQCLHVPYMAPLGWRRPLIVAVHDLGFLHVPHSFPAALRLALRVLVPWSIRRASRVVTASEFCRRDIESRYALPPGKVVAVPLAASAHFCRRPPEEVRAVLDRHGLVPGFLFALGRLNRRKNLERLLVAYGRLRASGITSAPLVIGGKPDYGVDRVLERAKLSKLEDDVRFTGLIPDAELPCFYTGAACFVYPSLFEGFGLPVLEAMACGTPVVSSNRAALPELVADAGLTVEAQNVDAIAEAIARVLRNPVLAAALGRRGIERSRRYSWAETARQTLAVCQAACRAGS